MPDPIKSINGNPIVLGTSGIEDGTITTPKLADDITQAQEIYDSGFKFIEANWSTGRINNDGSINSSETRWTVTDMMTFDEETTLFVDYTSVVALQIALYNPSETLDSIFYPEANIAYDFPAGLKFRLTIRVGDTTTGDEAKQHFLIYTNSKKSDRVLENALWQLETNGEPEAFTADFYNGNMSGGDIYYKQRHRVHTGMLQYNKPVAIRSDDDYRFYVEYYTNGIFTSESSISTYAEIPANQQFKLLIRKYENEPTYADPDIFKRKVKFVESSTSEIISAYKIPWMYNGHMRLAGHQGLQNGYEDPDVLPNSNLAFINSGTHKQFMCESDLQETSDGYFVMFHDTTVDNRTYEGTGTVSQMTLAQLRALHLKRFDGTESTQQIPTFEEYLQICKQYQLVALCEIKSIQAYESIENVVNIIKDFGMENQFCFIASKYYAPYIRQYTDIPICLLSTISDTDAINMAKSYSYMMYDIDYSTATAEFVKTMHNFGIPVNVYTVNSKANADSMFAINVDIITTDALTENDWIS